MTIVEAGKAIEGKKVTGHSRKPLWSAGLRRVNSEIICHRWKADHDVKAEVVRAADSALLCPNACLDVGRELACERAIIDTLDPKPSRTVKPCSGTHNANVWDLKKQSSVQVVQAHQEIQNAMRKKAALDLPHPRKLKGR